MEQVIVRKHKSGIGYRLKFDYRSEIKGVFSLYCSS